MAFVSSCFDSVVNKKEKAIQDRLVAMNDLNNTPWWRFIARHRINKRLANADARIAEAMHEWTLLFS